jgi:hypothetical protein
MKRAEERRKDMATTEKALRESIVAHGARSVTSGLGDAPDGDISARLKDSLLITPSGANYASLRPAMIARMPVAGEYGASAVGSSRRANGAFTSTSRAPARILARSCASSRPTRRRWPWRANLFRPLIR